MTSEDIDSEAFSVQMKDTPTNSTDISPLLKNAQPVFQSTTDAYVGETEAEVADQSEMQSQISLVGAQETVVHNKLTTLNGCYVPCLLNIMGIILFLRLGWAVGEAGVGGVLVIFAITEIASILTVLSLSAIVSNGAMDGGGCYFMISRTLGPEFGGSIGILFYAAYAVGITFYVTGFAEELRNTYFPDEGAWFIVGLSSICLFVCLLVALMGAAWFTKINVFLFVLQFSAVLIGLFAMFFRSGPMDLNDDTEFEGFSFESLGKLWESGYNMDSDKCPASGCSFPIVFAVVMPATTGIMEGANLSGDLKDPGYSIPVGTIAAVGTSIVFYMLLIVAYGGAYSRTTLLNSDTVLQETAWADWLVITGILISSASSALGALFGGSRILQALARDDVFPGLSIFAQGTAVGDEPTYAVLFTWAITQGCCFIFRGSLDAVANFISALFCLSYAAVNLSAFLLEVSGTPNFRPKWKYYTWHTCLIGMLTYFCLMFYLNWIFGIVAVACEVLIFLFLVYRAPKMLWGEVTQSVIFHQVRKYLLRLDERKMHSKLWRPSILLLLSDVDHALIDFCNQLKKGGLYIIGNTLVGDFQELAGSSHRIRSQWITWIEEHAYKAFPQVAIGADLRTCYQNLMLLAGLGAMSPNTVVIPQWKEPVEEREKKGMKLPRRSSVFKSMDQAMMQQVIQASNVDMLGWVECLQDILAMRKNIVVTNNFSGFDYQLISSKKLMQIYKRKQRNGESGSSHSLDVVIQADDYDWTTGKSGDTGFPMLLLQLAHIVSLNKKWQRIAHMRILLFISDQEEEQIVETLRGFLYLARIDVQQVVSIRAPREARVLKVGSDGEGVDHDLCDSYERYYEQLNQLIIKETKYSRFVFMKLPDLPPIDHVNEKEASRITDLYVSTLTVLTAGLPPSALVATGESINAISLDI